MWDYIYTMYPFVPTVLRPGTNVISVTSLYWRPLGMKSVGNGRTRNHKCRKTVGRERHFSTFMKVNYYKIMKNDIKIN
jgi:hypothetical protein